MTIKKEKCIINLTSFHYYVAINDLNLWLHLHILYTIGWATKKLKVTYTFRNATGSNQSYNFRRNNWVLYLCLSATSQVSLIWPKTFRNHLFCIFNYHLHSFFVIISTLHSLDLSISFWPLDPCPITLLTSWLQWVTSNLRQNCKPVSLFPPSPSSSPPFFSMVLSVH